MIGNLFEYSNPVDFDYHILFGDLDDIKLPVDIDKNVFLSM